MLLKNRWLAGSALTAGVALLSACSTGQAVVDQAQSAFGVTEGVQQACATAQPAWAPEVDTPAALAALTAASQQVTDLLADGQTGPVLVAVDQAIKSARDVITRDPSQVTLRAAVSAVQAACAVLPSAD